MIELIKQSKRLEHRDVKVEQLISAGNTRIKMDIANSDYAKKMVLDAITNAYSSPAGASVRELIFNAIDACVEAGGGAVKVTLPTILEPSLIVEDNGVGMDWDTLHTAYALYANSSKLDDVDTVGAKGLGAKAPLSFLPAFNVVTAKNGVEITARAMRGEDGNYLDVISTKQGVDWNGTKITLLNISSQENINDIEDAVGKFDLSMVPGVELYVDGVKQEKTGVYRFSFDDVDGYIKLNKDTNLVCNVMKSFSNNVTLTEAGDDVFNRINWVYGGYGYERYNKYAPTDVYLNLPLNSVTFPPSRDVIQHTPENTKVLQTITKAVFTNENLQAITDSMKQWIMDNPNEWLELIVRNGTGATNSIIEFTDEGGLKFFSSYVRVESQLIDFTPDEVKQLEEKLGKPILGFEPKTGFWFHPGFRVETYNSNLRFGCYTQSEMVEEIKNAMDGKNVEESGVFPLGGKYFIVSNLTKKNATAGVRKLNEMHRGGELDYGYHGYGRTDSIFLFTDTDATVLTDVLDQWGDVEYKVIDAEEARKEYLERRKEANEVSLLRTKDVDEIWASKTWVKELDTTKEFVEFLGESDLPYMSYENIRLNKNDMPETLIVLSDYALNKNTVLNVWKAVKEGLLSGKRLMLVSSSSRSRGVLTGRRIVGWATKNGATLLYSDDNRTDAVFDPTVHLDIDNEIRKTEGYSEHTEKSLRSANMFFKSYYHRIDEDTLRKLAEEYAPLGGVWSALLWGLDNRDKLETFANAAKTDCTDVCAYMVALYRSVDEAGGDLERIVSDTAEFFADCTK